MEESTRRLKRQFCFLSPLQEHHRILQELHNAVIFSAPRDQPPLAPVPLAQVLSDRYGGPTSQWRLSTVPAGVLLRTPLLEMGNDILFDAQFWEEQYGVWVNPWQCHEEVHQAPAITRVLIEIRDFPVDFWHPSYFLQASSVMGTLVAISPQNSTGENQASVKMWIDCPNTNLIPETLIVGRKRIWSPCQVDILGWMPLPDEGNSPEMPPGARPVTTPPAGLMAFMIAYTPRWRFQPLRYPSPRQNSDRRGAPAAQMMPQGFRCRDLGFTPSLLNESSKRVAEFPDYTAPLAYCKKYGFQKRAPDGATRPFKLFFPNQRVSTKLTVPPPGEHALQTSQNPGKDHINTVYDLHESEGYISLAQRAMDACPKNACQAKNYHPNLKTDIKSPLRKGTFQKKTTEPFQTTASFLIPRSKTQQQYFQKPYCLPSLDLIFFFSQPNPNRTIAKMENLSEADEALIQRFAGLHTEEAISNKVTVPTHATASTDWARCLLAKVWTNRTIQDPALIDNMLRAWEVSPNTAIKPVAKNCYFVEFESSSDLSLVLNGGPWSFRGDLVTLKGVCSQSDLAPSFITHADVWVQFYNIPMNSLNDEGVLIVAKEVGVPVTSPIDGFVAGKRFVKVRLHVKAGEPIKEVVVVHHPTLGDLKIYCCYEKVARLCRYCGLIGHDMASCPDHMRVSMILSNPTQEGRFNKAQVLAPKFGAWITNPALLPLPESQGPNIDMGRQNKRTSSGLTNQRPNIPYPSLSMQVVNVEVKQNQEYYPNLSESSSPPLKKPKPARHVSPAQDI